MLLAESGLKILLYPWVREQFAAIMRAGSADAEADEINWNLIVENWDLPFPNKMKPSATNPCTQQELDEIAAGKRPGLGKRRSPKPDPLGGKMTITSFDELNLLSPGLGDNPWRRRMMTMNHRNDS